MTKISNFIEILAQMSLSILRKRWFRVLAIVFLFILVLLFTINGIVSHKAGSLLREKLAEADTSGYVVDFNKVRVNVFTGSARLTGIHVRPSATAMQELKSNLYATPKVDASIDRIRLGNLDVFDILKSSTLIIGNISVSKPVLRIYSPQGMFPDKKEGHAKKTDNPPDSALQTPFHEIRIKHFEIADADISWMNVSDGSEDLLANGLSVDIDGVLVHHPEGDSSSFVLDVDDIGILLSGLRMTLPGNLYTLKTAGIAIQYREEEIQIDSLRLIPAYSKEKFGHVVGKQTDRFDLSVGNILVSGLVFDSIISKKVIIDSININHPVADIYRDKAIPRDMKHFPKLYQTAVAQLPIPVDVAQLRISDAYINYQEKADWSPQAGGVIFEHFNILVTGISNDPELIRQGHSMIVDGHAKLMGATDLSLHLDLPVGRKDEYFTLYGHTGSFPATILNPLIEPLASLEAKGGTISKCNFFAMGKRDTAVSRVEFLYNDMVMAYLRKEKESQGIIAENKFLSFLIQTALHNNNPQEGKEPRIGLGSFVRDPNKGFFNYIWKTIQDGLINSMAPVRSKHAQDMDWATFSKDWEKNLQADRAAAGITKKSKKDKKRK